MLKALQGFWKFLDQPLYPRARLVLLLLLVPLALSFTKPLWHIHMTAMQYPEGLDLYIYSYKVEGGHEGKDIPEINTLNHYIGMRSIDRKELSDLDWMPFAFGALALLLLRLAAIGTVRGLVDLAVLTAYLGAFSFARFYYKMWQFGHELSPDAPFKVEPFMPPVFGEKTIANFTSASYPAGGSLWVAVFAAGLFGVLAWHLIAGRIQAVREERLAAAERVAPGGASS